MWLYDLVRKIFERKPKDIYLNRDPKTGHYVATDTDMIPKHQAYSEKDPDVFMQEIAKRYTGGVIVSIGNDRRNWISIELLEKLFAYFRRHKSKISVSRSAYEKIREQQGITGKTLRGLEELLEKK